MSRSRPVGAPPATAALAALLASLALTGLGACAGKKRSGPKPLDCEALQHRAEACEGAILDLARRRHEVERVTAGATADAARERFLRFKASFQRRLRERRFETECRDLGQPQDRRLRKRASTLRFCFGRPDCRSFGECLLSR